MKKHLYKLLFLLAILWTAVNPQTYAQPGTVCAQNVAFAGGPAPTLYKPGGTIYLSAYSNLGFVDLSTYTTVRVQIKYYGSTVYTTLAHQALGSSLTVTVPEKPSTITSNNATLHVTLASSACSSNSYQLEFTHLSTATLSAGTIGGAQTITVGTVPTVVSNVTPATNFISYQWQKMARGSSWEDIPGATAASYQPPALMITTSYRRTAIGSSANVTSNTVVKTVSTGNLVSPDIGQNYIIVSAPHEGSPDINMREAVKTSMQINYFDGLGRHMQEVTVNGAAAGKDLVRPVLYDAFGREDKRYLPYERDGILGSFTTNTTAVTAQATAYKTLYNTNDGTYAYSQTVFDDSPLNRATKQSIPGYTHRVNGGKETKLSYTANSANEVKLWKMTGNTLAQNSFYAANQLYVTETTDAEGLKVSELTDKEGNVVEKWMTSGTQILKTSYVYDDYNRLRVVIPPKAQNLAVNGSDFNKLVYRYNYDNYGRLVEKHLPGADAPQYFVYDSRDRLVMFQDAVLKGASRWKQTLYDNLNRPVAEGIITSSVTHANFQSYFADTAVNQTHSNATYTFTTITGVPALSANSVLAYTYYDSYGGNPLAKVTGDFYGTAPAMLDAVKGQVTWTNVKVLDGNELTASGKWLASATHYDKKYRPAQVRRQLYTGATAGTTSISSEFAFDGNPARVYEKQTFNGTLTTLNMEYTYDHLRRPVTIKVNNTLIAGYTYDATGRMKTKTLGNNTQAVTYAYDIRDWLTSTSSTKFNSALTYKADGNIEKQVSANNGTSLTYNYTYDGFGRLLSGMAGTTGENAITYDNNGNIMTLTRSGSHHNGTYTYTYDGNRLINLKKGSVNYAYAYDANGNTTTDGLRGMTIAYNLLNLPKKISKGSDNAEYIYSATGEKLAKKKNAAFTQFYAGSMVYTGAKALEYIVHPEGLAQKNGSQYDYQYNLTDHLGNVRTVLSSIGTVLQANDYYPFGLTHISTAGIANTAKNKYLYNGKEVQNDVLSGTVIDFLDYGARLYDPVTAQWRNLDPLAEKYASLSPYVYCVNNPLKYVDPNGMRPDEPKEGDYDAETDTYYSEQHYWVTPDFYNFLILGGYQYSDAREARSVYESLNTYYYDEESSGSAPYYQSCQPVDLLQERAMNMVDALGNIMPFVPFVGSAYSYSSEQTYGDASVVAALLGIVLDAIPGGNISKAGKGVYKGSRAILRKGYYEVNGFKFTTVYYTRLWNEGRKAPSLIAGEVLKGGAKTAVPDATLKGFKKYVYGGWEMVYNPKTKEVWHLQQYKK